MSAALIAVLLTAVPVRACAAMYAHGISDLHGSSSDDPDEVSPEDVPVRTALEGMEAAARADIVYCIYNEKKNWTPDPARPGEFWEVIYYYNILENRMGDLDFLAVEGDSDSIIVPESMIRNAAYACFSEFDGRLPALSPDIEIARSADKDSVYFSIKEGTGVATELKDFEVYPDHSVDAVYSACYSWDDMEPAGNYRVHFTLNPHYDDENEFFTYYYTVEEVELIGDDDYFCHAPRIGSVESNGQDADDEYGFDADAEHGFGADDEYGFDADAEHGFSIDDEYGFDADAEHGFGVDAEHGFSVNDEHGFAGYSR